MHSFNGWGPGALPPDVTNWAPFGLISEKSNSILELFPFKYDFINTLIASAQPSILSPIKNLLFLFGYGLLTGGKFVTWCLCTEYPTPVPPKSKNIISLNESIWSIGKYAQLYTRLGDISIGFPPNCNDLIDGSIFLS